MAATRKAFVLETLKPADFPLFANGGFIYQADGGAAYLGPLSDDVAADLVERLNRDAAVQAAAPGEAPVGVANIMLVGPSLGQFPPDIND